MPVPSQDKVGGKRQEVHPAYKRRDDGGGLVISPDGVVHSHMASVSAYVIFPCTIKVEKISFETGSPGHKLVVPEKWP